MASSVSKRENRRAAEPRSALFYVGIGAAGGVAALLLCMVVMSALSGGETPPPKVPEVAAVTKQAADDPVVPAPPSPAPVVEKKSPTPWPKPTAQTAEAITINLLALVTPDSPLNKGGVRKVDKHVLTSKGNRWDVAVAPLKVPDEYTIHLVARSAERPDSLHLGLLVGGRPSSFIVDGFEGSRSGPFVVKKLGMTHPDYPGFKGTLMKVNEPINLKIAVTPRSIQAWADGRSFFLWQGDASELDWNMTYPYPAEPCLTVGSWNCPFVITEWTMTEGVD